MEKKNLQALQTSLKNNLTSLDQMTNSKIESKNDKKSKSKERKTGIERISLVSSQLKSGQSQLEKQKIKINNLNEDSIWNGFHKKSILERQHHLKTIWPKMDITQLNSGGLEVIRADSMIENCVGLISLPIGLGLNFKINSKKYSVPMAVEEPSVIAAASSVAKLISTYGGFFSVSDVSNMITQIHIIDTNSQDTKASLEAQELTIISLSNSYCQKMVQRGGGTKGIRVRILKEGITDGILSLDIIVDVCESMGANMLNTLAEGVAQHIENNILKTGKVLMKILSNLAVFRMTSSEFKIPVSAMEYKGIPGEEVCDRIVKAYEIACLDKFRATTHNKGIMNGIDAVALALGQDWRAIEAGCHTYACLDESNDFAYDKYKPLSFFKVIEIKGERFLYGSLKIPLALGVVGGAIGSNPIYGNLFKILGNPSSSELSSIMVSVGLSNNLAALRAIVCTGIQQGHMGLHAKNVAIRAGVPDQILAEVVEFMKKSGSINEESALRYLESHNLYHELRAEENKIMTKNQNLSNFYIEIFSEAIKTPVIMNIILATPKGSNPITFKLISSKIDIQDKRILHLYHVLFGEEKNLDWLNEIIKLVFSFEMIPQENQVIPKVKLLYVLLFSFSYNLLNYDFKNTKEFLNLLVSDDKNKNFDKIIPEKSMELNFGYHLLIEIYDIIKFYLFSVGNKNRKNYADLTLKEINLSLKAFISMHEIPKIEANFNEYLYLRSKRMNMKIMILTELIFAKDLNAFNYEKAKDFSLNLEEYLDCGSYIEMSAGLFRDYVKRDEKSPLNSYNYFIQFFPKEKYFENKLKEMDALSKSFKNNPLLVKCLENFKLKLNDFYLSPPKF